MARNSQQNRERTGHAAMKSGTGPGSENRQCRVERPVLALRAALESIVPHFFGAFHDDFLTRSNPGCAQR